MAALAFGFIIGSSLMQARYCFRDDADDESQRLLSGGFFVINAVIAFAGLLAS